MIQKGYKNDKKIYKYYTKLYKKVNYNIYIK